MKKLILMGVLGIVIAAGIGLFLVSMMQKPTPPPSVPIGDFAITSPEKNFVLLPGQSKSFKIKIQTVGGFSSDVTFKLYTPIPGVQFKVEPSPLKALKDGEITVDATLTVLKDAKPGNRNITFTAVAGPIFQTLDGTLNIVGTDRVIIEVRFFDFGPRDLTIKKGTTITWVNQDDVTHTSTSDIGVWHSGDIAAQKSWSRIFSEVGTYAYHCTPHPYMLGKITVID